MDFKYPYVNYVKTVNRYLCVIPVPLLVPLDGANRMAGRQLELDIRSAYKTYMNSCGLDGDPEDHPDQLAGQLGGVLKMQIALLSAMTELTPRPTRRKQALENQRVPC